MTHPHFTTPNPMYPTFPSPHTQNQQYLQNMTHGISDNQQSTKNGSALPSNELALDNYSSSQLTFLPPSYSHHHFEQQRPPPDSTRVDGNVPLPPMQHFPVPPPVYAPGFPPSDFSMKTDNSHNMALYSTIPQTALQHMSDFRRAAWDLEDGQDSFPTYPHKQTQTMEKSHLSHHASNYHHNSSEMAASVLPDSRMMPSNPRYFSYQRSRRQLQQPMEPNLQPQSNIITPSYLEFLKQKTTSSDKSLQPNESTSMLELHQSVPWSLDDSKKLFDCFFSFVDSKWFTIRRKAQLSVPRTLNETYEHVRLLLSYLTTQSESNFASVFKACLNSLSAPAREVTDSSTTSPTPFRSPTHFDLAMLGFPHSLSSLLPPNCNAEVYMENYNIHLKRISFEDLLTVGTIKKWATSAVICLLLHNIFSPYKHPWSEFSGVNLPSTMQSSRWWDAGCDKALLIGSWIEGVGYFACVRDNSSLAFRPCLSSYLKSKNLHRSYYTVNTKNRQDTPNPDIEVQEDTTDDETCVLDAYWPSPEVLFTRIIELLLCFIGSVAQSPSVPPQMLHNLNPSSIQDPNSRRNDTDNARNLPIAISEDLCVLSLGTIETSFPKAGPTLCPVGFKSRRLFRSVVKPSQMCWYICDVFKSDSGMVFRVIPEDDQLTTFQDSSPSKVWSKIFNLLGIQGSFPAYCMFGFDEPVVKSMIQDMTRASIQDNPGGHTSQSYGPNWAPPPTPLQDHEVNSIRTNYKLYPAENIAIASLHEDQRLHNFAPSPARGQNPRLRPAPWEDAEPPAKKRK